MTRASNTFTKLSALAREQPTLHDRYADPNVTTHQPDRGAAILAATDVENALETAIAHRIVHQAVFLTHQESKEIFQGDRAPLGTFSSKIWIAFAFGVYGRNTRSELDKIRLIRNAFAHAKRPINFETEQVAACCDLLTYTERMPRPIYSGYDLKLPWPPHEPKIRFLETTGALTAALELYSDGEPDPNLPLD